LHLSKQPALLNSLKKLVEFLKHFLLTYYVKIVSCISSYSSFLTENTASLNCYFKQLFLEI